MLHLQIYNFSGFTELNRLLVLALLDEGVGLLLVGRCLINVWQVVLGSVLCVSTCLGVSCL